MERRSPEYKAAQRRAMVTVCEAIYRGKLPRLSKTRVACVDCGARATGYDHRDYGKPLQVSPVCHRCNIRRGKAENTPITTNAQQLTCLKCSYTWTPRKAEPVECPACKVRTWNGPVKPAKPEANPANNPR